MKVNGRPRFFGPAQLNSMKTTLINNTAPFVRYVILKLKSFSDFKIFNIIVYIFVHRFFILLIYRLFILLVVIFIQYYLFLEGH